MRGFLAFLVVAALTGGALAVAAVTVVLPAVVSVAVRDSPFLRSGTDVRVDVDASLIGVFLHGSIDRITIAGDGLSEPSARVAAADVDLDDVSILDHSFAEASGTLSGVDLDVAGAGPLHLATVTLQGSSRTLEAVADLDATAAVAAIRRRLAAAGLSSEAVTLTAGRIDVTLAGRTFAALPVITSTEVRLEASDGLVSLPLVTLPTTGEWRITAIQVTPSGIRVTAVVILG